MKHPARQGRWATISDDERYRYVLGRQWDADLPVLWWVMHNPSTADALTDDATIRRVVSFSTDLGFGTAIVANLFALRATDPSEIDAAADPAGPRNDATLDQVATVIRTTAILREGDPTPVVCAWGARARKDRVHAVVAGPLADLDLRCLGTTRNGQPRHPLYVRAGTTLVPWSPT